MIKIYLHRCLLLSEEVAQTNVPTNDALRQNKVSVVFYFLGEITSKSVNLDIMPHDIGEAEADLQYNLEELTTKMLPLYPLKSNVPVPVGTKSRIRLSENMFVKNELIRTSDGHMAGVLVYFERLMVSWL